MQKMRSECKVEGFAVADDGLDEQSLEMILNGIRRDLKLRQTTMIRHNIHIEERRLYVESTIDVFAQGKKFVISAVSGLFLIIIVAILNSAGSRAEQFELLRSITLIFLMAIPLGYGYLVVEKRLQHARFHRKMESKIKEIIKSKPMIDELLKAKSAD